MNVAFRADASIEIGSGHVMRCLTLADELAQNGEQTRFFTRALPGHLAELIRRRGHPCTLLPAPANPELPISGPPVHAEWLRVPWSQDADEVAQLAEAGGHFDWLVVDHYGLDARWQRQLRAPGRRILVIDDLADRDHDCDMLVDHNLQERPDRYDAHVPPSCRLLIGPRYALLRPQFAAAREAQQPRKGTVHRILVFFGGSDPQDLTGMALDAIARLGRHELSVDVVFGANNQRRDALTAVCARMQHATPHWNIPDMAALMTQADLAIGAAGVTTWERACLGLPSLVVTVAANQRPTAACSARRGIFTWLGDAHEMTVDKMAEALRAAMADPAALVLQSRLAMELVDAGGAARIVEAMKS